MNSRAFWWSAPGRGALRAAPSRPVDGRVMVQALYSAVSPGTERRVGNGGVSASEARRMACPHMEGSFEFPLKYGYALAAKVLEGDLAGRRAFVMHPHQDFAWVDPSELVEIPAEVPSRRATLFANLETALNAVWDAAVLPGERVAVVGAGIVGALVAWIIRRIPGVELHVIERDKAQLGRAASALGGETPGLRFHGDAAGLVEGMDAAFDASGSAGGLQAALDATGFEGRCVVVSWHGEAPVPIRLGGGFHPLRKSIVSSQVSSIPAAMRSRWDRARRARAVMDLLRDPSLDAMITRETAFEELPELMEAMARGEAPGLACVARY